MAYLVLDSAFDGCRTDSIKKICYSKDSLQFALLASPPCNRSTFALLISFLIL